MFLNMLKNIQYGRPIEQQKFKINNMYSSIMTFNIYEAISILKNILRNILRKITYVPKYVPQYFNIDEHIKEHTY